MANLNGLTVTGGNADLEVGDGSNTYGYLLTGSPIIETRGSSFVGSVGSGAPTYQDAEPFSRHANESFEGGFGQLQENRVFGGPAGMGGSASRYYYGDCWTAAGGILLPGMVRNTISSAVAGNVSPVSDDYEIVRGILPSTYNGSTTAAYGKLTPTANVTFQQIYIMARWATPVSTPISVSINGTAFTTTVSASLAATLIGWKWVLLGAAAPLTLTGGVQYDITVNYISDNVAIGCYVSTADGLGVSVLRPYFQIIKTASSAPYRSWRSQLQRIEVVTSGGAQVVAGLTTDSYFVATNTAIAEYAAGSTPYTGSIVFDNKLYVGDLSGAGAIQEYNAATVAAGGAPNNTATIVALGPAVVHNGNIYFVNALTNRRIAKWSGTVYGAGPETTIIADDQIGKPSGNGQNNINNIIIYRGLLYAIKPEGMFLIDADPARISTAEVPRIIQLIDFKDLEDVNNGRWMVEHQGVIYFNVQNRLYALSVSDSGNQVQVITPPFISGNFTALNYINGLASDGQALYVGYNNIGIMAYKEGAFHPVSEFYYSNALPGIGCALRVITSTTGGPNMLYFGDYKSIVQMPIPSYSSAVNTQIYKMHQNKCASWISSFIDADLADIYKYWRSIILRALPNSYNYKAVAAFWQSGSTTYRNIIETTYLNGMKRDRWTGYLAPSSSTPQVITTLQDGSGTTSPAIWTNTDFQNASFSSEKLVATDDVAAPIQLVSGSIVLYMWSTDTAQYTTLYDDMSYIESIVLKFMPVLKYIPIYKLTIDLAALLDEESATKRLTRAKFYDTVKFLRDRARATTPTQFAFRDPITAETATTPYPLKPIKGFITTPQFAFDSLMNVIQDNKVIPRSFAITILSIEEE